MEKWIEKHSVNCYFCGPETNDGYLEDTYDGGISPKLEELLADLDVSTQDAENHHSVALYHGWTAQELWAVVRARLIRSGAVERTDWGNA